MRHLELRPNRLMLYNVLDHTQASEQVRYWPSGAAVAPGMLVSRSRKRKVRQGSGGGLSKVKPRAKPSRWRPVRFLERQAREQQGTASIYIITSVIVFTCWSVSRISQIEESVNQVAALSDWKSW